ncbi:MAG: hypothetical protein CMJ78_16145 [Planctomycetaceae bacterium]|nr:hypothetical protein [Planctomycetaceae bacterium]
MDVRHSLKHQWGIGVFDRFEHVKVRAFKCLVLLFAHATRLERGHCATLTQIHFRSIKRAPRELFKVRLRLSAVSDDFTLDTNVAAFGKARG